MSGPMLAKKLGLSRQYLSRAEQGTYTNLNPALQKWVAHTLSISEHAVKLRYLQFQKTTRQATFNRVGPHKLERRRSSLAGHVLFERWRSGYWTSPTQFAIAFCIHPDSVQKYEEGIQKRMPDQLRSALLEVELIDESWSDELSGLLGTRLSEPI